MQARLLGFTLSLTVCFCSGYAHAQACGQPPVTTAFQSGYTTLLKNMFCRSSSAGIDVKVPIDGLPVGFGIKQSDASCTGHESFSEQDVSWAQTYIASSETLMAAECGYRLCMLLTATQPSAAVNAALGVLSQVCGGVSTRPTLGLLGGGVYPVEWNKEKAGQVVAIPVSIQGSADSDLVYAFSSSDPSVNLREKQLGRLVAGTVNVLTVMVRLPDAAHAPRKGSPEFHPFYLRAGRKTLIGTAKVFRSTTSSPTCVAWEKNECVRCEVPLKLQGGHGARSYF